MQRTFYTGVLLIAAAIFAGAVAVSAQTELDEFSGTPLPLAIHDSLRLEVLPLDVQDAQGLAGVFPAQVEELVILRLYWPEEDSWSAETPNMLLGFGTVAGTATTAATTYVLLQSPAGGIYRLADQSGNGQLGRMCIWPMGTGNTAMLLLMYSMYVPDSDNRVYGFAVMSDGEVWDIDADNARTINGWFAVSDLDRDGDFELVTQRGLDGSPNGFTYRAVRSLDAPTLSFSSDPDPYRSFFQEELEWLNWVVETRGLMQLDPEKFMSRDGSGPFYSASYRGTLYGFDSIIEVPVPEGDEFGHIVVFNEQRAKSFDRIVRYRDEMAAWLTGGDYPSAWNIR